MIEEMPTIAEEKKMPDDAADIGLPEKNSHKAVRDYQEAIYEDLPPTIMREVPSNAVDAHRMLPADLPAPINIGTVDVGDEFLDLFAKVPDWRLNSSITTPHVPEELGKEFSLPIDRNVEVDLSTGGGRLLGEPDQPILTVTDWGPGMSPAFMRGPFTEYRTTGKGHTNRLIGGKGIGAKCPLGYKDVFLMDVCWEGVMRTYVFQRLQDDDQFSGDKMFVLSEEEYDERPFGTRVRVPVDEDDIKTFKKACVEELVFLADEIDFTGDLNSLSVPEKEIDRDNFSILKDDDIKYNFDVISSSYYSHRRKNALKTPIVTIGGVPYNVDLSKIDDVKSSAGNGLVIKMDPGSVKLTLSRDSLKYNDKTKEAVAEAINEKVVPELKNHLSQQAGDVDDLTPLQSKLLKSVIRRDPSEYDEIPPFVAKNQKSIKLLRKLDSIRFSFVADANGFGNLKKVRRNSYGKSDYNFKKIRIPRDIPNMLAGSVPTYWTLGDTRGHINRKLTDRHKKYYLWRLDEDSDYLEEAKEKFLCYDDVEVEERYMTSSVNEESNNRFAAYEWSVQQDKYAKNYETPASVNQKENTIVYGHKNDREDVAILARLNYFLKETGFATVVRVAKSNASAMENGGHQYIGEFDRWDELKTRLARQYNAYDLAKQNKWFKHFKHHEDTKPLYRIWNQVRKASRLLWRKKPSRSYYSSRKDLHDMDKDNFPANIEEETNLSQTYPDDIGQYARRLKNWRSTLYALKNQVEYLDENNHNHNREEREKSIITLLKPRLRDLSL